ncbi:hypothetical protein FPV67DRAFT_1086114 [Lyophyllum atratum]|nr:hypothetical protein FPV67DRAFT_1086114 [Lyophyllum atratum]
MYIVWTLSKLPRPIVTALVFFEPRTALHYIGLYSTKFSGGEKRDPESESISPMRFLVERSPDLCTHGVLVTPIVPTNIDVSGSSSPCRCIAILLVLAVLIAAVLFVVGVLIIVAVLFIADVVITYDILVIVDVLVITVLVIVDVLVITAVLFTKDIIAVLLLTTTVECYIPTPL